MGVDLQSYTQRCAPSFWTDHVAFGIVLTPSIMIPQKALLLFCLTLLPDTSQHKGWNQLQVLVDREVMHWTKLLQSQQPNYRNVRGGETTPRSSQRA